jgi:signal transduction histidine kinase
VLVEDNGIGFKEEDLDILQCGIGLSSIRNRLKLLNGIMRIKSRQGRGTIVEIEILLR